jgi:putative SOS response-associated peptidase YedK
MCGRYSNAMEFSQIRLTFRAEDQTFRVFEPRLNIAPSLRAGSEQIIIVAGEGGERWAWLARFSFVPEHFRRPLETLPSTFNARAETIFQKPLFREASQRGRCLVPATGWREFREKQPYHFVPTTPSYLAGSSAFAFAGIRAKGHDKDGSTFQSFAILTTAPTAQAAEVHERMPLLLPTHLYDDWLSSPDGEHVLAEALSEAKVLSLSYFPSDPIANSSRYEGSLAITPKSAPPLLDPPAKPGAVRRAAEQAKPAPQLSLFASAEPGAETRTRRKP